MDQFGGNGRAPVFLKSTLRREGERLAEELLNEFRCDHVRLRGYHFDDLYPLVQKRFNIRVIEGVDLGCDEGGTKILGVYNFIENVVRIDATLGLGKGDRRRVFTLFHEVFGHGVLQGKFLREKFGSTGSLSETEETLTDADVEKLEVQANFFAGRMAAPDFVLRTVVAKQLRVQRPYSFVGPGTYCVTTSSGNHKRQHCETTDDLASFVASMISEYFGGLSDQALGIRLREAGLIRPGHSNGRTGSGGQKSIGKLFRREKKRRAVAS